MNQIARLRRTADFTPRLWTRANFTYHPCQQKGGSWPDAKTSSRFEIRRANCSARAGCGSQVDPNPHPEQQGSPGGQWSMAKPYACTSAQTTHAEPCGHHACTALCPCPGTGASWSQQGHQPRWRRMHQRLRGLPPQRHARLPQVRKQLHPAPRQVRLPPPNPKCQPQVRRRRHPR